MKIVYFTHSLRSCWNHGNAHFLRGILSELASRGHEVHAPEPATEWSVENLLRDHGAEGLEPFRAAYPELTPEFYDPDESVEPLVDGADLVIAHEWNEPELIAELGSLRKRGAPFTLLFHDTHHRAVSAPEEMEEFDLSGFDGILAFGEALSEVYRGWGWEGRVWTWHEAADLRRFHPPAAEGEREGLVWIGNWGDEERSRELVSFLLKPARNAGLPLDIYGVRYPGKVNRKLKRYGASYHGWAPNPQAPEIFARHIATVHVPRGHYTRALPGIPTIRVFEALACGIPLVCAPWQDSEKLFRPGEDYLVAKDGSEMTRHLKSLKEDPDLRASLAKHGLETVRARHSCAHRVDELMDILAELEGGSVDQERKDAA